MTFNKTGLFYDIIQTKDVTSENIPIFKFTVWNSKGQIIDSGRIFDFSIEQARDRVLQLNEHRVAVRRF